MCTDNIKTILMVFLLFSLSGTGLSSHPLFDAVESLDDTNNAMLHITKINDGVGLTITIDNIGDEIHKDVSLTVEVDDGLYVMIPKKTYHIEALEPSDSTSIHISVFGIGLGQLADYPRITLSLSSSIIMGIDLTVITRVIGPYCTVLGEFFNTPFSYDGYTLFSPEYSKITFLMDNDGNTIHQWESNYIQGLPVYLDEQGNLIRGCSKLDNPVFLSGGFTGRVEIRDWNNTLQWEFDYSTNMYCLHHDIEPLPNGNILMIAWEYKSTQEAINQGRDPNKIEGNGLWPDHIIEVKPIGSDQGEIVWEWHVWDHLIQEYDPSKQNYGIVRDHPELIDLNYGSRHEDWTHLNSIDYNPLFDQIMVSVHNFNEVWVIDHSTTTEEAAGHTGGNYGKGGDLLYRWGNPQAYQRGKKQDQRLFGQHDAQWIEPGCPGEGNILVFNNGVNRPDGPYSTVDEIKPPVTQEGYYLLDHYEAYEPKQAVWVYRARPPLSFFSGHISGAQRLPNGNTLICSGGAGVFFEVTRERYTVWNYLNTFPDMFNNHVFKIKRYPLDYPGVV